MAKDIYEFLDPNMAAEAQYGKAMASTEISHKDYLSHYKRAHQTTPSRQSLVLQSIDLLYKQNPDIDVKKLEKQANDAADQFIEEHRKSFYSQAQAVGEGISKGAAALPEQFEQTQDQRTAVRLGLPWKMTESQALRQMQVEAKDPATAFRYEQRKFTPEEQKQYEQLQQEPQMGGPKEPSGVVGQIFNRTKLLSSFLAGADKKAEELALAHPPTDGQQHTLLVRADKDWHPSPSETWDMAKAGAKNVLELLKDPDKALSMSGNIERRAGEERAKLFDTVSKEMGLSPENKMVIDEVDKRFKAIVDADDNLVSRFMVRHPVATETAVDIIDPAGNAMNQAGLAAVAKGAAFAGSKALGAVPAPVKEAVASQASKAYAAAQPFISAADRNLVQPVTEAAAKVAESKPGQFVSALTDAFTYNPDIARVRRQAAAKMGSDFADEIGRVYNTELELAEANVTKFQDTFSEKIAALDDEIARSNLDRGKLFQMVDANVDRDLMRSVMEPEYRKAYDMNAELADLKQAYDKETALLYKWTPDELVAERGRLNSYVPHYERIAKKSKYQPLNEYVGKAAARSRSALHRKKEASLYVQDPVTQWRAWQKEDAARGLASLKTKKLYDITEDYGLVRSFTNGGKTESEIETLASIQAEALTNSTGIKYTWLNPGTGPEQTADVMMRTRQNNMNRLRYTPTARASKAPITRGSETILMPESVAKMAEGFRKVIAPETTEQNIVRTLAEAVGNTISTYMSAFRYGNTIIRSPAFVARNFASSFGLSHMALGERALDPKLQGQALAMAYAWADKGEDALPLVDKLGDIVASNGQVWKPSEVLRLLDDYKILNQLDAAPGIHVGEAKLATKARSALESIGELKPLQAGAKALNQEWLATSFKRLSPGFHAKASENYQRLSVALGVLGGKDRASIAKTIDLTSKLGGNYSRMGALDKGILRNLTGFYGWNRWIFPRTIEAMYRNPERVRKWVALQGGLEKYFNEDPSFDLGQSRIPHTFSAPESSQPPIGSHEYAIAAMDNPAYMAEQIAGAFKAALAGDASLRDERAIQLTGPWVRLFITALNGRDPVTGQQRELLDLSGIPQFEASAIGQVLSGPLSGPMRTIGTLSDMWVASGQARPAASAQLRLAAGRDFFGLDHYLFPLIGRTPISKGGWLTPQEGGIPGIFQYIHKPSLSASQRKKQAVEEIPGRAAQLRATKASPASYGGAYDFLTSDIVE
jgi:hypothetical protein